MSFVCGVKKKRCCLHLPDCIFSVCFAEEEILLLKHSIGWKETCVDDSVVGTAHVIDTYPVLYGLYCTELNH